MSSENLRIHHKACTICKKHHFWGVLGSGSEIYFQNLHRCSQISLKRSWARGSACFQSGSMSPCCLQEVALCEDLLAEGHSQVQSLKEQTNNKVTIAQTSVPQLRALCVSKLLPFPLGSGLRESPLPPRPGPA